MSVTTFVSGKFELSHWEQIYFRCATYGLITIILLVNKGRLYKLNVDKNFVAIFIGLGYIYSIFTPQPLGVLIAVAAIILTGSVFFSSQSEYAKNEYSYTSFILFLIIFLILDFIYFILIHKAKWSMGNTTFMEMFFLLNLPFLLAEEFMFRGLLWEFLEDFNIGENKIIFIQALLFWLCHFYFYVEPIAFWIFLPLMSVLLGYLITRTKSLTFSLFLHIVHNFFSYVLLF